MLFVFHQKVHTKINSIMSNSATNPRTVGMTLWDFISSILKSWMFWGFILGCFFTYLTMSSFNSKNFIAKIQTESSGVEISIWEDEEEVKLGGDGCKDLKSIYTSIDAVILKYGIPKHLYFLEKLQKKKQNLTLEEKKMMVESTTFKLLLIKYDEIPRLIEKCKAGEDIDTDIFELRQSISKYTKMLKS